MCKNNDKILNYISAKAVMSELTTQVLGRPLIVLDSVDSTNDYIKSLADEFDNGTIVVAREQSAGKGRLGRKWITKKDDCLAFSILLKPQIAPDKVTAITPLAGLAVCKAVRDFTGLDCMIKWPNDVIIGSKKLCGILTELSMSFNTIRYIVLGVGLNISQTDFPAEISEKATSLFLESGKSFDKNKLFATIINYIEAELKENNFELSGKAIEEYTSMCATIGRTVYFSRGTEKLSGEAVAINDNSELLVMLLDGTIQTVNSGEVTVQGIY
ncbi:MAG: biotin--[acetyl-CoA-carboxylase] ligase [Ruminococcus sp.]|nr:biotin--[acetyl-CoA-carboxylase] ligase [Ruminococcus sp.]